jgi:hypothetical protein
MAQLPSWFVCPVVGPNGKKRKIRFAQWDNGLKVKYEFSERSGYPKNDLTVLFGEHEMTDFETPYHLGRSGFTRNLEFSGGLANSFPIIVETEEKKEFIIHVNSKTRLTAVSNVACFRMKRSIPLLNSSDVEQLSATVGFWVGTGTCHLIETHEGMDALSHLSPHNICFCPDGSIVITSFDLSGIEEGKGKNFSEEWKRYSSPEMLKGEIKEGNEKSVVFVLGMTMNSI